MDTVYAHVLAWQKALATAGINATCHIHRRIGLSGKELAIAIGVELRKNLSAEQAEELDQHHGSILKELLDRVSPLRGAVDLLRKLSEMKVTFGIATSGNRKDLEERLKRLDVGTYSEFYPEITQDIAGRRRLFRQFSTPVGIPSHAGPHIPGSIYEGGELGYSLTHAFGAAFDNSDLLVACMIGDGEAETGPLEGAWKGIKSLNPARDGAMLFSGRNSAPNSGRIPLNETEGSRGFKSASLRRQGVL